MGEKLIVFFLKNLGAGLIAHGPTVNVGQKAVYRINTVIKVFYH